MYQDGSYSVSISFPLTDLIVYLGIVYYICVTGSFKFFRIMSHDASNISHLSIISRKSCERPNSTSA
jgi:hypothetical protein